MQGVEIVKVDEFKYSGSTIQSNSIVGEKKNLFVTEGS